MVEVHSQRMGAEQVGRFKEIRCRQALERFHRFHGNEAAGMHDHWSDVFRQWAKPQHPDEPDEEYENRKSILTIEEALIGLRQTCKIEG